MVYVDTSFLMAFYVLDAHSMEAVRRTRSGPSICISPLNRVELANGVSRQVFVGKLSQADAATCWKNFEGDITSGVWSPVAFGAAVWERCVALSRQHAPALGVRTLDSLHVACALELRAERFWTFDDRQARLAEAVGLDVRG